MNHTRKLLLAFTVSCIFLQATAQKKTTIIPPGTKVNNGLNFASKIGRISYYFTGLNGKKTGLVARNENGKPVTLFLTNTARVSDAGQTSYAVCEVCYAIVDEDGDVIDESCYEVDCSDLIGPPEAAMSIPDSKFPRNPGTGTFAVFQSDELTISAVYKNNRVVSYKASGTGNGTIYINYVTNVSLTGTRCTIKVTDVRPDGTVREVIKTIPCSKVPAKPKSPNPAS